MSVVLPDNTQSDRDPAEVTPTPGDAPPAHPKGMLPRQKLWLTIVIVTNLLLWLIPSDVVKQIANDEHVMLGRYGRRHFSWNLAVLVITAISLYIDWGRDEVYKRRWFRVIAMLIVMFPMLVVVDFVLRGPAQEHYVRDTLAYHRPPGFSFAATYEDKPKALRTYPNLYPGYDKIDCKMTIDERGYRNAANLDKCDVVALGDSFAEGSSVSDEHPWAVRLAEHSGLSVYNLGMSGYDAFHYLESLKEHGLGLQPRYVVCMIYEGNDFRSAKSDRKRREPSFSARLKRYTKQSPLTSAIDTFVINTFGPINSTGPVTGSEVVDWLPLFLPHGSTAARAYAFEPKQLRDLYITEEEFSADKHWLNPRGQLGQMNELCREAGATFFVVFAPTKAHVTVPLVGDRLPAEHARTFTKYKYKDDLPESEQFLSELLARVESRENVVRDWCERESIPFIGITDALRRAITEGKQAYFSYDQHWTPIGHDVVAEVIAQRLTQGAPRRVEPQ